MFNRKASNPKNRPNQILEVLNLQSGQKIADIGAGGGYFSLRFARAVGEDGRVYAVDTSPKFLRFIEEQARENGCANVETILAAEGELGLPERSLDLVFMRNVCHHIEHRPSYFVELRKKLNPTGKVAIIEYKPGGRISFHKMFGHYVPEEVVAKEMESSGYRLRETYNFLPEQSFTVYSLG
jgi:ubiquinone/menaquinone biosynthesis C-methylase UbiE